MKHRSTNRRDLLKIAIILGLMYVYRKQLFSAVDDVDELTKRFEAMEIDN